MVLYNCCLVLLFFVGFHIIFLPYADDKRNVDFTEKVPASREQVDKMKEIIQKLRFKYRYMELNSEQGVAWVRKRSTTLFALLHTLFRCHVHEMVFSCILMQMASLSSSFVQTLSLLILNTQVPLALCSRFWSSLQNCSCSLGCCYFLQRYHILLWFC